KGRFPAILERPEARELYDDALGLLDEITSNSLLLARGQYGYWSARAEGDDVVLDDGTRFCFLRQQAAHGDSRPNRCLADYVSAAGDHVGAFAVAVHGADELAAGYEAEHDDYRAIMVKAIADRLAEAFAELPAASVSGLYLAHPEARYFSVGRIARDQVEDYARRQGIPLAEAERWLRPNLAYEPVAELVTS